MYLIELEDTFNATHAVRLPTGRWESPHRHQWRVRAFIGSSELDENHFVADFAQVGRTLRAILADLENADLNSMPRLEDGASAELVARYIFDHLSQHLTDQRGTVTAVAVREAENCWAWFLA